MSETAPVYEAGTAGRPWRCERCGGTLAVVNGQGMARAGIDVQADHVHWGPSHVYVTCPYCGRVNVWCQAAIAPESS